MAFLRPSFIDRMSWEMAEVYGAITDQILINLAKYFPYWKSSNVPKSAFEYQATMLAQMGQVNRETIKIIRQGLKGADKTLQDVLEQAIMEAVSKSEPQLLQAVKKGILKPAQIPVISPNQTRAFNLYYQQAAQKLNLVNTVMLESTKQAYQATVADIANRVQVTQTALDIGAGETITGVSSWNQAVKHSIDRMKANGITGFIDHGDHHWSAEAYTAMDIRTTVANTARAAVWETNQDFGNDLYLVSYHNGARPLCYPWQNKVISSTDNARVVKDLDGNEIEVIRQSDTSYGEPAGLFGINCKHYPTPFIPGVSVIDGEPQSKEENDKTYEEMQKQRALERKVREEKRDLLMMKAQGATEEEIKAQRAKIRQTDDEIDAFCDETGLHRRQNRESVYTQRSFPDPDTYDVSEFENKQKDEIEKYYKDGGSQQSYTFGQMTPNVDTIIEPESIPTPQLPTEVKEIVAPDIVEQALNVQQYQPMKIETALEGANPKYNSSWGYNNNCQRCVQAYEMRRRGYPVEALQQRKGKKQIIWGSECFGNYGGGRRSTQSGFTWGQTEAQVKAELANAPDGARYSIYVDWKKGNSAHVFIAEKVGNVVRYVDPQSNELDVSSYFGRGRPNGFGFFRMDDKPITTDETLLKLTMKKGK